MVTATVITITMEAQEVLLFLLLVCSICGISPTDSAAIRKFLESK